MQGPSHIKPAQDRFEGAIEIIRDAGLDYHVIQTTSFSLTKRDCGQKSCSANMLTRMGSLPAMTLQLWQ